MIIVNFEQLLEGNGKLLLGKFPIDHKLRSKLEKGELKGAQIDATGATEKNKFNSNIVHNINASHDLREHIDFTKAKKAFFKVPQSKKRSEFVDIGYVYELYNDDPDALSRLLTSRRWEHFSNWPCIVQDGYEIDKQMHHEGTHRTAFFNYGEKTYFILITKPKKKNRSA